MSKRAELTKLLADLGKEALAPSDVLAFARDYPESEVGQWFARNGAFDTARAVENYGLLLAGRLLRIITVRIERPGAEQRTVRLFHSLPSDRSQGGTSYRPIQAIMARTDLAEELIESVINELEALRKKHATLAELSEVWRSIDAVKKRRKQKQS